MDILIVGATGSGKSKLGDLIRNLIFKMDAGAKIVTEDPDRENKTFGEGENLYNLEIRKVSREQVDDLTRVGLGQDVIVVLANDNAKKWLEEYE